MLKFLRRFTAVSSSSPSLSVEEQAVLWWLQRCNGLEAAEESRFQEWLSADAGHREAWNRVRRTERSLDALPTAATGALVAIARAATYPASAQPAAEPRRRWLKQVALASLSIATGVACWHWADIRPRQPAYAQVFEAGKGQQARTTLPDGSRIELDAGTRMEVAFFPDRRLVKLLNGQAYFDVVAEPSRPFMVEVRRARVTVVGTRFAVRYVNTQVHVAVEEGQVMVQRQPHPEADGAEVIDSGLLLQATQTIVMDDGGTFSEIVRTTSDSVAPWRHGRVVFDNTPLTEVLAEFARYGSTGVFIREPSVAAMRITGTFEIGQFSRFCRSLPEVLPVRLIKRDGGWEIARR